MTSHSAAIFSFEGKIVVRVRVKKDAKHITLPLKSAKVLPSSYEIPCTIENGHTIVSSLIDRRRTFPIRMPKAHSLLNRATRYRRPR